MNLFSSQNLGKAANMVGTGIANQGMLFATDLIEILRAFFSGFTSLRHQVRFSFKWYFLPLLLLGMVVASVQHFRKKPEDTPKKEPWWQIFLVWAFLSLLPIFFVYGLVGRMRDERVFRALTGSGIAKTYAMVAVINVVVPLAMYLSFFLGKKATIANIVITVLAILSTLLATLGFAVPFAYNKKQVQVFRRLHAYFKTCPNIMTPCVSNDPVLAEPFRIFLATNMHQIWRATAQYVGWTTLFNGLIGVEVLEQASLFGLK